MNGHWSDRRDTNNSLRVQNHWNDNGGGRGESTIAARRAEFFFFFFLLPSCYYGYHTLFGRIVLVHVAKMRARLGFKGRAR